MLAAGWVGMGAGYLGRLTDHSTSRFTIGLLAVYGGAAGLIYGLLLDLWEWPLLLNPAASTLSWAAGLGITDLTRRFAAFYLATSLVYDTFRAAGNIILIAALGAPVVVALNRFRRRFLVQWTVPVPALGGTPVNISTDVGTPA
jgi:energy-coupling factor transport system substrate-specific component